MNKQLLTLLHWTWNLPSSIIGYIVYKNCLPHKIREFPYHGGTKVLVVNQFKYEAFSSCPYIIFGMNKGHDENSEYGQELLKHEYGHTLQQLMLGPLAWPVLGILAFFWAVMKSWGWFKNTDYFSFFTEAWANKLGKVKKDVL